MAKYQLIIAEKFSVSQSIAGGRAGRYGRQICEFQMEFEQKNRKWANMRIGVANDKI